jgi:hypothetical protein
MKGRQRFVCIHCGLKLSGRLLPAKGGSFTNGRIVAYDRAPDSDAPPEPCVCAACLRATCEACAEVWR